MKLENIRVYDLEESMVASGYPMRTDVEDTSFNAKAIERCMKLTKASNGNGAHGQWLTGVRVAFDLTCTNKMWVEAERYRFLEFVSSQSTMHRITNFDVVKQYNKYVDDRIVGIMQEKINDYNLFCEELKVKSYINEEEKAFDEEIKKYKYLEILYSNPAGFELTARLTTNYRCLLNIYVQRHNHRLPEWREFCEKLLELPYFEELVKAYYSGKKVED